MNGDFGRHDEGKWTAARKRYRERMRAARRLTVNRKKLAAVRESNLAHRLAGREDEWSRIGFPYRGPGLTMFGPDVLPMESPQDCRDRMAAELREQVRLSSARLRERRRHGPKFDGYHSASGLPDRRAKLADAAQEAGLDVAEFIQSRLDRAWTPNPVLRSEAAKRRAERKT